LPYAQPDAEFGTGRALKRGECARGTTRVFSGLRTIRFLACELIGKLLLNTTDQGVA
jgi:hypothetical protein